MKTFLHKASERGHVNHGWLNAFHSFNFASWYNPDRTNFGVLRVLNDDTVAKGMGFGKHPHDNMEIITIVQKGSLKHQDSIGNTSVIVPGEVQVMSAGTGITHSEQNSSQKDELKLFQIWVFPNIQMVTPRYGQKSYSIEGRQNIWQTIICPIDQQEGNAIGIYQNAWFSQTDLDQQKKINYTSKKLNNGAYVFVIDGEIKIGDQLLTNRDAMGITNYNEFDIVALVPSKILVIDIPMYMHK
ncbi:MAG: pirin family protein [Bacteroidia bacterium]|nr:pirin family protein [Bacteroidia bacterium]